MSSVQTTNCRFEFISIIFIFFFISNHTAEKCLHSQYISPTVHTKQGCGLSPHLQSSLGPPSKAQAVGQYSGCDSGPVVAAPAHKHDTQAGHTPLRAERHLCGAGARLHSKQKR